MDPMRFLSTKDEEERSVMQAIAHAAQELERQADSDRAAKIANAVWKEVS